MTAAVVDASIVVRWLLDDELSPAARTLATEPIELLAPELLLIQTANALWKAHRATALPLDTAKTFLARLPERLTLPPTGNLLPNTFQRAAELQHPAYDVLYLTLAERLDLPLLTLDRRFLSRLSTTPFSKRARHLISVKS